MRMSLYYLFLIFIVLSCSNQQPDEIKTEMDKWWSVADRQLIISELNRTTEALRNEIIGLSDAQWNFKESPDRWSVAEIVEHLEMQNQLHYREITIVSNNPQHLKFRTITEGKDQHFIDYATDTIKGTANWFLQPLGRFCSKTAGENAFFLARGKLTEWVDKTNIDLRKQFTFRIPVDGKEIAEIRIGQVRDLHQLLLTGIAHTDRHLRQVRNIKKDLNYPVN